MLVKPHIKLTISVDFEDVSLDVAASTGRFSNSLSFFAIYLLGCFILFKYDLDKDQFLGGCGRNYNCLLMFVFWCGYCLLAFESFLIFASFDDRNFSNIQETA